MDIILTQDVENLGIADDLVTVKSGYARNYLIPKKLAMVANEGNRKNLEEKMKQKARREEQMLSKIQDVVDTLKSAVIKIGAKVGTTEKIFGSVTTHHIAEEIKKQVSIEIDRRKITIIEGEVKTLGTYSAEIDLHENHKVNLSFEVVAD